ncbi:hypothetical protein [uncultured Hydrogenophaga sp.]|uniref:hypothetical protein n=1 Tax=uncultured Hydrogenophaga sp. TaxID=199683 RepID=UPI00265F2CB6|nr:hypothetical protein [uncultured Hydrogenophaga sp.]
MSISRSSTTVSSRSSSSSLVDDGNQPPKGESRSRGPEGSKSPPKNHSRRLDKVRQVPTQLRGNDSEDTSSSRSSHSNTAGVFRGIRSNDASGSETLSELFPVADPRKKPKASTYPASTQQIESGSETIDSEGSSSSRSSAGKSDTTPAGQPALTSVQVDLDAATADLPKSAIPAPIGSFSYDALRASWPGAVAYAGSFMMGRAAQFALTVSGNPVGSAMAFATVAGMLHIGMEPIVGALRAKMGMRSDKDTKNYTNFVTSLAVHLDSWFRNDEDGMKKAETMARESLAPYFEGWDSKNDPMPAIWDRAMTMLKAGARGFASNELPFYVFSAVYMLTNPAGLWVRSSVLEASANKDIATVLELLMSVAGGAIAGVGTVGVQNAARAALQGTGDAPLRASIRLNQLNRSIHKVTRHQLGLLKNALKASLRESASAPDGQPDINEIEKTISEALRLTGVSDQDTVNTLRTQLDLLPGAERERLLKEVRVKLNKADKPYTLGGAIATNYLDMVATRNAGGVFQADGAKIQRVLSRTAANVAGLMAYASALVHVLNTIAQYGPANTAAGTNATGTEPETYPTTDAQAYGEMAALGPALITSWVLGRGLAAPALELFMTPLASLLKSTVGSTVSAGSSALRSVWNYLARTPVANGAAQADSVDVA